MSRVAERRGWTLEERMLASEVDHDIADQNYKVIRSDMRTVKRLLIGLLVSVTSGSLLLAGGIFTRGG
jgi:hypothetical protein